MKAFFVSLILFSLDSALACRPFELTVEPPQSISGALSEAEKQNACAVKLTLAPGSYMEVSPIKITRDTEIEGVAASAVDTNASFVNESGKNLTLKRLKIIGAKDNAVLQSGGVLEVHNTSFIGTQAASSHDLSGVAVVVQNGGTMKAAVTEFIDNQNGAVILKGRNTLGQFGLGTFSRNQVRPALLANEKVNRQGAFRVSDGAEVYFYVASFEHNQLVSLSVTGSNSKVYMRNGSVSATQAVGDFAGTGILVQAGAKMIIEKAKVSENEGVGLSLDRGFVTATDLVLENNRVGAAVSGFLSERDYDVKSCLKTRYVKNGKDLDAPAAGGIKNIKSCPQFPWKWDANMRVYLR